MTCNYRDRIFAVITLLTSTICLHGVDFLLEHFSRKRKYQMFLRKDMPITLLTVSETVVKNSVENLWIALKTIANDRGDWLTEWNFFKSLMHGALRCFPELHDLAS